MRHIIRFSLVVGILISFLGVPAAPSVYAQISLPAEVNKSFTPISIMAGGISRLSVSIYNPNAFQLNDAAWTDNLAGVQPGIVIANPVNLTNTCGGTVTANSGATLFSLNGGMVPAQAGITPGSCTVSIDVTSTTPGNLINTIPTNALTATGGGFNITNTTPASATLRVGLVASPSVNKSFNPNTIWVGQSSQLTITIRNNDLATALTQTSLTDNLPADVVLANPVSPTLTGCGTLASLTAVSGNSSLTLNNATIAVNSTCTIRVNVTSDTAGVYTNTIPADAIQNQQGVTNPSSASARLNVQDIGVSKSFSPPAFQVGGTSTLTITLQNPSGSPYTGVSISDTLPTALLIIDGSEATTCGGAVSVTMPRTIGLTGGTIPASSPPPTPPGVCAITVQVTSETGATPGRYTNTIPADTLDTDQGATNVLPATAPITIYDTGAGVTGRKTFNPTTIDSGGNSRLRIDITAPADTDLTNFSLVDNLPAGVTVSNSTPASTTGCGAGAVLTAVTGATSISLTNGTILAGTLCRINVYTTSTTSGVHTNVIHPSDVTNNENRRPANDLTADLTVLVLSDLSVSKAFTPDTVSPNGISTLTITLQNMNASPLVNASLLDTLPGSVADGVVVAPVPNASTTCTGGVITAIPGTQTISMTGGTIPAQSGGVPGICTISVDVQGVGSPATRTNTIPASNVSGEIQGTGTIISPAQPAIADLIIANLSIGVVKGFDPLTVFGGSPSTLSIQLVNPNNAALNGIAFTDTMPAGMIIANPPNFAAGTCGGTLTGTPGSNTFSFSGGNLPIAASCTLTLNVTMTVNGNLTNTIPANAVTTTNGVTNPQPAQASLTNLPGASISKFFAPNPIAAGDHSILTITIQNTGNIPLTGLGLVDTLPAGLEVASAPASVNNCGGVLTAIPGSRTIELAGGGLGASSSCTLVVSVTGPAPGDYENCIPVGALTNDQGAQNNQPACDTLTITAQPSGLTKTVDPPQATIGEIVTYQVTMLIPPGTYPLTKLTDTLERGLAFVGCDSIDAPGLETNVSGGFPAICSSPTVDDAGGGMPEDVDRRVTFDFGTLSNSGTVDATVTVSYDAIILNTEANVDGVTRDNSAVWTWENGGSGPVHATVEILEPELMVDKTADVNFIALGTEAVITLTVSHTSESHLDAYDVVLTDPLPMGMDYVPDSLDCTTGAQDPDVECAFDNSDPTKPTIRAAWSVFTRSGGTGLIRFRVMGNESMPADGSVTNVSLVTWTSLPGDQSIPNSFSDPPNQSAVERSYDPGDPVNFYGADDALVFTPTGGGDDDDGGDGGGDDGGTGSGLGGFLIPVTGFPPDRIAELDGARATYSPTSLSMEIPTLQLSLPIVGIQFKNGTWDVGWLWNEAGWLQRTAYPTFSGNSVITAHIVNADGKPGPFARIKQLDPGEYIYIDLAGYRYTYKVVTNSRAKPNDISVLRHEEKPWLTLVTCDNYNYKTGKYLSRVVIRAVLIDIDTK